MRVALRALLVASLACACTGTASAQSRRPASEARALQIRAEMANVLLQSRRYAEAAREFRALLELDPDNWRHRLALVRALAWGGRPREADRELAILRAQRRSDPAVDSLLVTVRVAMKARADEAASWLAERPGYAPYRRALAQALVREGRTGEALAHYDTLLQRDRAPELFVERASVHLKRGDEDAAERDLRASIAAEPSVGAFIFLGDVRRGRGDFTGAVAAYDAARALRPRDPLVAAAFARLARDRRPAIAFAPDVHEGAGWQSTTSSTGDNLGARYSTLALRRAVGQVRDLDASVGGELRWFAGREAETGTGPGAYGADVALSRGVERGTYYGRARGRVGILHHPRGDATPLLSLALGGWAGAWGAGLHLATAPAYPSLLTLASFLPAPDDGRQLRENSAMVSVAGPAAEVDVAASAGWSALSDGNRRSTVQGYARWPLTPRAAMIYAGSVQAFERGSAAYWSPVRYVAHSLGAEYGIRSPRGLSYGARLLPGIAVARERTMVDGILTAGGSSSVLQLAVSADAAYRGERWEVATAVTYGRGRAGGYERTDAVLQLRVLR